MGILTQRVLVVGISCVLGIMGRRSLRALPHTQAPSARTGPMRRSVLHAGSHGACLARAFPALATGRKAPQLRAGRERRCNLLCGGAE